VSPRVGPIEIPAAKGKDPRRDDTDPPKVELSDECLTDAAKVASFRTGRVSVSLPAATVAALIAAVGAAAVAWINKPPPPAPAALTAEQARALDGCARVAQDVAEIKTFVRWAEPQIGVLLVRTDSRAYAPPPRVP
jgi:hypothetical protein